MFFGEPVDLAAEAQAVQLLPGGVAFGAGGFSLFAESGQFGFELSFQPFLLRQRPVFSFGQLRFQKFKAFGKLGVTRLKFAAAAAGTARFDEFDFAFVKLAARSGFSDEFHQVHRVVSFPNGSWIVDAAGRSRLTGRASYWEILSTFWKIGVANAETPVILQISSKGEEGGVRCSVIDAAKRMRRTTAFASIAVQ